MSGFWKGLGTLFKRYFVSGFLVLIPIIGTIWILKVIIVYADGMFTGLLPARIRPDVLIGRNIPGVGLLITIGLVLLVGVLTRLYIGKQLVRIGDSIIAKIPLGRGIYKSIKQLMGAFISDGEGSQYKRVVAVEYPRRGCYMIGFVLGPIQPAVQAKFDKPWISIFLPTSPNPTSGFMISVPDEETTTLPITTDQAFKYIISGNVDEVAPSGQSADGKKEI